MRIGLSLLITLSIIGVSLMNNSTNFSIGNIFEKRALGDDFDKNVFNIELLEDVGVDFPVVVFLQHFKETSFCKEDSRREGVPTLCSYNWESLGIQWNPHNYVGMKHPSYRETTSIGSIGEILENMSERYGFEVPENLKDDPHAVYLSARDCAIDMTLYQQYWYNQLGYKPDYSEEEYIDFIRETGYNPNLSYFISLNELLEDWRNEKFLKYETYFIERTNGGRF